MIEVSGFKKRLEKYDLSFAGAAPVKIAEEDWVCLGFQEAGIDRGDFVHLALLRTQHLSLANNSNFETETLALLEGELGIPVRLHSECLLGDALGSTLCDCGDQLQSSLSLMNDQPVGVLVYLRQEGRGIGMPAKLVALARQRGIIDGVRCAEDVSSDEANIEIGHKIDERDYVVAANLLLALRLGSIDLITGNPEKIESMKGLGIPIRRILNVWDGEPSQIALREREEKIARGYRYAEFQMEASPDTADREEP